jgi:hypothetical protein
MSESNVRGIDNAISSYIKGEGEDGSFVTGWLMIASVSSPDHDSTHTDGYVTVTSDGLPHHTQIGLLNVALDDKRALSMFSAMGAIAVNMNEEDEENE